VWEVLIDDGGITKLEVDENATFADGATLAADFLTGTAPYDGEGPDLADVINALSAVINDAADDTLIVAGADFSHVGPGFGDDRELTDDFLDEVRQSDAAALDALAAGKPDRFRTCVAEASNPTRVCSVGCMFTLASVLADAAPSVLKYHQAVTPETQQCVTCAAVTYA